MNKETVQQAIWTTLRTLKSCSLIDIRAIAGVAIGKKLLNENSTRSYLNRLHNHGYVESLKADWFKLVKNTGYWAPQILQDKSLLDVNTEEIFKFPQELKKPKLKQQVIESIKDGKEFTLQDLNNKTACDLESVRTVLKRLKNEGLIELTRVERQGRANVGVYKII